MVPDPLRPSFPTTGTLNEVGHFSATQADGGVQTPDCKEFKALQARQQQGQTQNYRGIVHLALQVSLQGTPMQGSCVHTGALPARTTHKTEPIG